MRNCRHRELWALVLTIVVAVGLIGPGPVAAQAPSPPRTTIQFWWRLDSAEIPFVEDVISRFHKEHPTIDVKMQYFAKWPEYLQKMQIALAGGTAPDLAFMKEVYIYDLSWKGATTDLTEFVRRSKIVNRDMIAPQYFDLFTFKGEQIAIPFNGPIMALFYNKDLFREAGLDPNRPPTTWTELRDHARALTKPEKNQWGFAVYEYGTREINLIWFLTFFWEAGGRFWKSDYSGINLDSPAGVEALDFLVTMIRRDKSTLPPEVPREGLIESNRIGMWMQGNWALHNYVKYAPKLNYGTAPLPKHKDYGQYIASDGLMIPKTTKRENKEAAWKLIEFLLRPDVNVSFNIKDGFLPVTREALGKPPFTTDPRWKTFVSTLEVARPLPTAQGFAEMAETKINPSLQAAMFGKKPVKEALEEATRAANEFWASKGGSRESVRVLELFKYQP
jgi:multiple sugar transport system substrate-binding protein